MKGWKGSMRTFVPKAATCFECAIDMFPPAVQFQGCTLAHTPRQPEHCIAYVKEKLWDLSNPFGGKGKCNHWEAGIHVIWWLAGVTGVQVQRSTRTTRII